MWILIFSAAVNDFFLTKVAIKDTITKDRRGEHIQWTYCFTESKKNSFQNKKEHKTSFAVIPCIVWCKNKGKQLII